MAHGPAGAARLYRCAARWDGVRDGSRAAARGGPQPRSSRGTRERSPGARRAAWDGHGAAPRRSGSSRAARTGPRLPKTCPHRPHRSETNRHPRAHASLRPTNTPHPPALHPPVWSRPNPIGPAPHPHTSFVPIHSSLFAGRLRPTLPDPAHTHTHTSLFPTHLRPTRTDRSAPAHPRPQAGRRPDRRLLPAGLRLRLGCPGWSPGRGGGGEPGPPPRPGPRRSAWPGCWRHGRSPSSGR